MQREITEDCNIFEKNGEVMAAGWSRTPNVFTYNPELSKAGGKLSERDCYFVSSPEAAFFLCIESFGLEFMIKIAVADLKHGGVISDCIVKRLSFVKNELPESGRDGEFIYDEKNMQLRITNTVDGRYLKCDFIDFAGMKNLYANITLKKIESDSMNEIAPFERNRKYFYFKRVNPGFTASGVIRVGGLEYSLSDDTASAYIDWTRFYKPRAHRYRRLGAQCELDGKRFMLSLANRVGDNRYGTENCFFVDGEIQKLAGINVTGTLGRLDRPYYFKAGVSAVDITFKPFTVRGEPMAAAMDKTFLVFGRLYGTLKRADMTQPIELDNAPAHMLFTEF